MSADARRRYRHGVTASSPLAALLLDCDGVLVDSTETAEEAWTAWAEHYGLAPADVLSGLHGRRSVETVARHLPEALWAEGTALIDGLEVETADRTRPILGAVALLESMPASAYAVVTSAPERLARARLSAAGVPVPPVLVTSEDVTRGKPSPDCYLLGASRMGAEPGACAVLEDSPNGIAAARAAGVGLVVGVGASAHGQGADLVVPDLTALRWRDGRLHWDLHGDSGGSDPGDGGSGHS